MMNTYYDKLSELKLSLESIYNKLSDAGYEDEYEELYQASQLIEEVLSSLYEKGK